jgi:hypothetical protein
MGNHAAFVLSIANWTMLHLASWAYKLIFHAMLNTRKMFMTEKNVGLLFGEPALCDLAVG